MTLYSSRPPFNDDPAPLVHPSGKRTPAFSYHFEFEPGESGPFGKIAQATFDPRPEFDRPQHNPTNPVLTWARDVGIDVALDEVRFSSGSYMVGSWVDDQQVTVRHVIHARRVLERLARFTTGAGDERR